jgi:hypothetical protein
MTTGSKHDHYAGAITRSVVLDNVLDTEQEDDFQRPDGCLSLTSHQDLHEGVESSDGPTENGSSLLLGASLEELRAWLDAQCEKEQAQIDWSDEHERLSKGRIKDHNNISEGPDTSVLSRIRAGYGPRSSNFEDLLWPLRLDRESPRFSKQPRKESQKELEDVLLKWNRHVGVPVEDSEAREALVKALFLRIDLLDRSSCRSSADAHNETCGKLLHAIWAYRLETVMFETQDTCNLLTIILAHLGHAIPDIDQELKYLMFYTLVAERQCLANITNARTARKLERLITEAKLGGDMNSMLKYERQKKTWDLAVWQKNCDVVADRVKIARRNVELQGLKELQELSVLQSAQKIVLAERIARDDPPSDLYIPRSSWLHGNADACDTATTAMNASVDEHLSDILAGLKVATRNIDTMKDVTQARVLTRAMKFAGLDLKDHSAAEKKRVVKARMAEPETGKMMRDAYQAIIETNDKGRETVDLIRGMDDRLEQVLQVAEEVRKEHAELARRVEGDPMMVPGVEVDGKLEWEYAWEKLLQEGGKS